MPTTTHEIRNRWTGKVQLTAQIDCAEDAPLGVRIGLAVKWAVETCADLADANLADAYLAGADLARADLARADLAGANLARANLAGADLADADLADANLAGANLAGADLAGADLAGADLAGADLAIDAGTPNGHRCIGWLRDGWLSVRVGCRDKRIDEGRAYWAGKDERREVLAALDYVEAVAKLRGWALAPAAKSEAA